MARFSFGGQADLSGIFADMYRIGDAQAARERNAEDQNVINQWETGEISDEEFYAYAEQRIADSADDPEERSQWEQVLRNARQTNEGEAIEDTAEDIMDGIESGTRSWDDLLNYYKAQKRKLKPSDPLYRELADQIDQVEDRKRDNEVASTYGSIDYRFRSGQISGAQAGKEMRALAERYKKNDPQKYYELLGQALDLERPAIAGGSGGGGGRGGGSGGSGTGLKDTIDDLKGFEDRLLSLARQARDGQRVGSITVPGEDGIPVTETLALLNKDGSVTSTLRGLHEQTLLVYDELERALIADGKDGEAGSIAARRATFITDYVQPANTISKERQWERLSSSFVSAVERAASASSPAMAWRDILSEAERLAKWGSRLNTRTTSTDVQKRASDKDVRENPELAAAVRRQTTTEETDVARRILPEFESDVLAQIGVIMDAARSGDPEAIRAAFENLPEGSPLVAAGEGMAQNRRVVQGLADGSFQMVIREDGIQPFEVIRDQVGVGPDGGPALVIAALANAAGEVVWKFDPSTDGPMTNVLAKVGSEYMPVMATTQRQTVAEGDIAYYRNPQTGEAFILGPGEVAPEGAETEILRRGQALPDDVAAAVEKMPEGSAPPPMGDMLATQLPNGETFYGMELPDGTTGWYRNRVPRNTNIPALPAPYTGPAENAQAAFTRMGLDTTGRMVLDNAVATGNRVSMRAYDKFAGIYQQRDSEGDPIAGTMKPSPRANIQRATGDVGYQQSRAPQTIDPGKRLGSGTFKSRQPAAGATGTQALQRPERPTMTLAQTLSAVRGDTDPISNIRQIGESLGLRGLGPRGRAGDRNLRIQRPNIKPVSRPAAVNVTRPNVNVAGLRAMRARLLASQNSIRSGITANRTINPGATNALNRVRQQSGGFI